MAITAMGIGTKQAPENVNLDPQRQFWSWLSTFKNPDELGDSGHHERAYFSGFACTQTTPAGMSIQIGGGDEVDSAAIFISGDRAVLLSTDGTPETATIPTAPASGSRIDAVVSYIDTSSPSAGDETPGTPEYVKTIVVSGTASGSPTAPTDAQIVSALPAGANAKYYRWCDVRVAQGATVITNSNITDRKPDAPELYWTTSSIWSAIQSQVKSAAESAAKRLAPDWKKATNITTNTYTPTQNGFIYVACILDTSVNNSAAQVTAGGTYIYHMQNARNDLTQYNTQHCATMPVAKGVPIKFILQNGATWQARRFCPYMLTS